VLLNILTVDFEEWHHPEYVRDKALEPKADQAAQDIEQALKLLEEHTVEATFFVVGETVEKHPELLHTIKEKGHEIAFHSYDHKPLWNKDAKILEEEINRIKSIVSDLIGFRAPSFSLNNKTRWALEVLDRTGLKYDSSVFPIKTPLYGVSGAPLRPYRLCYNDVAQEDDRSKLWEFPPLVYDLYGAKLPLAGGFYLRFFPTGLIERAIRKANKNERPAVLYCHTWELNPHTPRLKLGLYRSFVTYHNLEKAYGRMSQILSQFKFASIRSYIENSGLGNS